MLEIKIKIEDEKVNTKLEIDKSTVSDLSVAIAQLEMTKLNLLSKIATKTELKKQKQNI